MTKSSGELPVPLFIDISRKNWRHRTILISLWLLIIMGILLIRSVLLPFVLASLLAYVFHPIVSWLAQIKIKGRPLPRAASVLIIYLVFALLAFIFCTLFLPQFYREVIRLVKDATTLINAIDDHTINEFGKTIEQFFRDYQLPVEIVAPITDANQAPVAPHRPSWISIDLVNISHGLINDTVLYLKSEAKNIVSSAKNIIADFISLLFMMFLVLMITGFLLVDLDSIKKFAFTLVPLNDREQFNILLVRLDQRLSGVVRGQLTICLINALLTLVGLIIFHIKFAFILATIAGVFSIVPIFGSILSTVPIVLVALTISPMTGLAALLWIIAIHALEANLLNPKIMSDSAKIHPVLIILALLAGEHFYGIIGALVAVPIISIITTIFSAILGKAEGMDEGVAKPVKDDRIGP